MTPGGVEVTDGRAEEAPRLSDLALRSKGHWGYDAAFLDACRLAQLGSWSGWLEVDGERHEVTPDRWWGSRDRSWGIRPVGEAYRELIRTWQGEVHTGLLCLDCLD